MRVEAIDSDVALALSAQTSYVEMMGLNGIVMENDLVKGTGADRAIQEKQVNPNDLRAILAMLRLDQNKRLFLRLLQRGDLLRLMGLMDKQLLINGLNLISKEKLLSLISLLPMELLIKMMLRVIPLDNIISRMPMGQLFAILQSKQLTVPKMIEHFKTMDPKYLAQLLGKIVGKDVSHLSQVEMLNVMRNMKKHIILDGMKSLSFKALIPLVFGMVNQDKSLLLNMSLAYIYKMFDELAKPNFLEAFQVVPNQMIIDLFLSQLPDKFLVEVVNQMDTGQLEDILIAQFPNIITAMAQLGNMAA